MEKRNVALILLYDKNKRLLLQHRSEDSPRLAGYWAFFGGGIENNETPEQAVKRETKEELEYELKNPKLVMSQKNNNRTKHVFMEEYDPKQKLVLREGQDMCWYHPDETKQLKIVDHDRDVLEFVKGKY